MWNIPTLDMEATGKRIKALFKERNLKVRDIRQYLELESEQAIYKWLRGESLPSIDNLYAMSVLFGLTINDMLVGHANIEREEDEPLPFFVFYAYSLCSDNLLGFEQRCFFCFFEWF